MRLQSCIAPQVYGDSFSRFTAKTHYHLTTHRRSNQTTPRLSYAFVVSAAVDVLNSTMGAGTLQVCPLISLPPLLNTPTSQQQPFSTPATPQNNPTSLQNLHKLLGNYPGPLSSISNKDKVHKYIKERADACGEEEGIAGSRLEVMKSIWEVLRVMTKHQGQLKPPGKQACGVMLG